MANATEPTNMQSAFAVAFVDNGGNASKAARTAGYALSSCRVMGSRLLDNPRVQEMIRTAQWQRVNGSMASKALGVLWQILNDDKAPPGVRVDAAKTVLDRAGLAQIDRPQNPLPSAAGLASLASRLIEASDLAKARARAALEGKAVEVPTGAPAS